MTTTPLTDRLRKAKEKWDTLFPNISETVQGQSNIQIPKETITLWFSSVIASMDRVEQTNPDPGLKSIFWQTIESSVASTENHLNAAMQNGAPWIQQTSNTLLSYLWSIRSSVAWLLPTPIDIDASTQIPRFAELEAQAAGVLATFSRTSEAERKMGLILSNSETVNTEIAALSEKIISYERASQTSSINAAASATASEAEKLKVDSYVQDLSVATIKQQELFDYFENKRAEVDATLQGASRVALAKSFEDRRKELTKIQYFWAILFFVGICTLTGVGVYLGISVLQEAKAATAAVAAAPAAASTSAAAATASVKASQSNLLFSLLRFLILAPVVWFTWFAARQYGHSQRLGEDYAFKSAAAHAYVGYKEEMDGDENMIKMLREYAVKNFGANPIRVLSKNEPASPLHQVFDKILDKASPDKLIDLIKDTLEKGKN
ncbi:hypothetical protein [Burkholderia sp. Bp8992]|uniref:hypothetical protein n=1 Tax=Burkholderia sp. Bp8992 TaxID=2184554 RepID=UPI000F564B72|nr:hypothetical protein [Burkholderia sp. Bp8992]